MVIKTTILSAGERLRFSVISIKASTKSKPNINRPTILPIGKLSAFR